MTCVSNSYAMTSKWQPPKSVAFFPSLSLSVNLRLFCVAIYLLKIDKGNEEEEMPIRNMLFENALHLIIRLSCHYLDFTMINSFFHVSFASFFFTLVAWYSRLKTSHCVLLQFDVMFNMLFVSLRHWHCHCAEQTSEHWISKWVRKWQRNPIPKWFYGMNIIVLVTAKTIKPTLPHTHTWLTPSQNKDDVEKRAHIRSLVFIIPFDSIVWWFCFSFWFACYFSYLFIFIVYRVVLTRCFAHHEVLCASWNNHDIGYKTTRRHRAWLRKYLSKLLSNMSK